MRQLHSSLAEAFVSRNARTLIVDSPAPTIIRTVTSTTSKGENTYQRTGPREQWFIPEMGEFSGHLADRAVELGYHRLRVALTDSVDQRAEAPGFRLARHWKLINPNYQFLAITPFYFENLRRTEKQKTKTTYID